jgi:thioredoxin-like negative regulator of GroEL
MAVTAESAVPGSVRAGSIEWHTTLASGMAAARASNTPMLLDFWADWCAPCKVMEQDVYPNADVVRLMAKVTPVKINYDKEGGLVRKYAIDGVPTLMVTDASGNELFRYTGMLDAPTFVQLLQELPRDISRINDLNAKLATHRDDADTLQALGMELRRARLYRASNGYLEKTLKARSSAAERAARAPVLVAMGRNHLELREGDRAARLFERYLKENPSAAGADDAMLALAQAHLLSNDTKKGYQVLDALIARYPSGAAHDRAVDLLTHRDLTP